MPHIKDLLQTRIVYSVDLGRDRRTYLLVPSVWCRGDAETCWGDGDGRTDGDIVAATVVESVTTRWCFPPLAAPLRSG
jgi:hypothetical protein